MVWVQEKVRDFHHVRRERCDAVVQKDGRHMAGSRMEAAVGVMGSPGTRTRVSAERRRSNQQQQRNQFVVGVVEEGDFDICLQRQRWQLARALGVSDV